MSLATLALSLVSTKYRRESTEKKNRGMGEKKEREMSNAGVYHRHLWCVQTKKAMGNASARKQGDQIDKS